MDARREAEYLERLGYTRTKGIAITANRTLTEGDLEELRALTPAGIEVAGTDNEYQLKSEEVIVFIKWALGLSFAAYFTNFMGIPEVAKKHREALGNWFRKKATHFETMEGFHFYKGNWLGQYKGVNIEVAINEADHVQVIEAVRRFNQVLPLVDRVITENGPTRLRLIQIMYASGKGEWILNHIEFSDGTFHQAPLDGTWAQDEMRRS